MFLVNVSNSDHSLHKFGGTWEGLEAFLIRHDLEGVEIILHEDNNLTTLPDGLAKGLHLKYYPTWMDFYHGDQKALDETFVSLSDQRAYYGGDTLKDMIATYKKEHAMAIKLGAHYMVCHVAHVTQEETFTRVFKYTNRQVMTAMADVINQAFEGPSDVWLLFENLWWPGMTLLDQRETKDFLDSIHYPKKGIMLDLSHLMLTNPNLTRLDQATDYILKTLEGLGDLKDYIKGIHVNKALPGAYLTADHTDLLKAFYGLPDALGRYVHTVNHIKKMDWHLPYDDTSIQRIMDAIKPLFVVYEVMAEDLASLDDYMEKQNKAFNRKSVT